VFRKSLTTLALCFSPLLYVTVIEPMDFSAPTLYSEFYDFETEGYSFRWSSEADTGVLECRLYEFCLWVDVEGPECADQLHLAISFYDSNENVVNSGRVVVSGEGNSRFNGIEIGTTLDVEYAFYNVDDVWCSSGVPTGLGEV
jgi:hypothetical protein